MTRKGESPKSQYTGIRYSYGRWEVISITTLQPLYYYGKLQNGMRTSGCRRDLAALLDGRADVAGLIEKIKRLYEVAKFLREPHQQAIRDIDTMLTSDVDAAIKAAGGNAGPA